SPCSSSRSLVAVSAGRSADMAMQHVGEGQTLASYRRRWLGGATQEEDQAFEWLGAGNGGGAAVGPPRRGHNRRRHGPRTRTGGWGVERRRGDRLRPEPMLFQRNPASL